MTKIELPVVSRWIIHDLAEDGICTRCGWYFWSRINGESMLSSTRPTLGGESGTWVFGVRDEDNGYVIVHDPALVPDAEQCVPGEALWPPGFDLIIEESETVPIPYGEFKAADRLMRVDLLPWSDGSLTIP